MYKKGFIRRLYAFTKFGCLIKLLGMLGSPFMAISMMGRRELNSYSCMRQEVSAALTQNWGLESSWELLTLSVYWKTERKKATDVCRWWVEEELHHFSYLGSEPIGWWSLSLRDYPVTCSSRCPMCQSSLEMPPQKHPWVLCQCSTSLTPISLPSNTNHYDHNQYNQAYQT